MNAKKTHDVKRKAAAKRAAAVPATFSQLTLSLSKADLVEAFWGVCSLLGEDDEDAAVSAAIREVNVWRGHRGARPVSAKPFETEAGRALFTPTKEALLRLAALVKKVSEEEDGS